MRWFFYPGFAFLLMGAVACSKKPTRLPQPQPGPAVVSPAPHEPAVSDPASDADRFFAEGNLPAAEQAYRKLLEGSLEASNRAKTLLKLAMIHADPSTALYDPGKALDLLRAIENPAPEDRHQASALVHLLERMLDLEAGQKAMQDSLESAKEELEKLKSIDERRTRRP